MKYKKVTYQSLFNPKKTFVASNRCRDPILLKGYQLMDAINRDIQEDNHKCRCKHPLFMDGYCHYRTCRHSEKTHC